MKEELQEKIQQFIDTLPSDEDFEWYTTDRSVGITVLNAFLWWLYPDLKPKDHPSRSWWPRLTYEQWREKMIEHVWDKAGCSIYDLPDCPYRDWYEDGVAPVVAGERAISQAWDAILS